MSDESHWTKEKLIEQIRCVYETDIGDFKRKAALYLNRWAQSQKDQKIKKKIQNLRDIALYAEIASKHEMDNIDRLRLELLDRLKNL